MNRTLLETTRSTIFNAGLSKAYWGSAVVRAAYIRDRVVASSTGVTPYERWYEKRSDVSNLKVFGQMGYALIPDNHQRKWDSKIQCLCFVGYGTTFGPPGGSSLRRAFSQACGSTAYDLRRDCFWSEEREDDSQNGHVEKKSKRRNLVQWEKDTMYKK